jgi:hypothetical protein
MEAPFDDFSDEKANSRIRQTKAEKPARADRPPAEGFVVVVDGHFKSEFDAVGDC